MEKPANNLIGNVIAFAVLALLWIAIFVLVAFNTAALDSFWNSFRGWPFAVQILVGLLTLPLVLGLWAWESGWPFLIRLLLIIGFALASLYAFYPFKKKTVGQREIEENI